MTRLQYIVIATCVAALAAPAAAQQPPAPNAIPSATPPPAPPPAPAGKKSGAEPKPELKAKPEPDPQPPTKEKHQEVIEIVDTVEPGAAHVISGKELERFERDDIHKVLAAVPGVYIREEDGYGLRPNIGMRGTGSERSAKIALMEDGVLIAPAPYSAPAAYYFPLVTRMSGLEVLKGPAAIRYGPNTVGGALNLISRPIPTKRTMAIDVAGGSDLYGKAHAYYGESTRNFGWLVEGVKLRTDGFKQLDVPGTTGFDKHSALVKLRANTNRDKTVQHDVLLKLGYGDEVSDETYTGLSDADFAANPYRRYAGTQLDRMNWRHTQAQLQHVMTTGAWSVTTILYRNDFSRDWRKLARFNTLDRDLREILGNPTAGNNAVYYALLTGAADSTGTAEALMIGTNSRSFVSQGIQTSARTERSWFGWTHTMQLGTRLHYDRADRFHFEDGYMMQDSELVDAGMSTTVTRDTRDSTTAWATHYSHKISRGKWTINAGSRGELIHTKHRDAQGGAAVDNTYFVLIPGGGAVYQARPDLGVLVGVHRGFVPVSPGQAGIDPEQSINYEAGVRFARARYSLEAIGFFSDYTNLIGTCTFSAGCSAEMVDSEFNGGSVHSYGAEVLGTAELRAGDLRIPVRVGYTFQRSRFQSDFSSSNPQWGEVSKGDLLPYLPAHQLNVQAGVRGGRWELAFSGRYSSAMRDTAGPADAMPSELTDSALVLSAAADYAIPTWGKLYVTVENVLDEVHISSRRPFGARPGVPRLIVVGYKNSF